MLQGKIILSARPSRPHSGVTLDRTLIVSRASLSLYINAAPRRAAYPLCSRARREAVSTEREREEETRATKNFWNSRIFSNNAPRLVGLDEMRAWIDLGYPRNLGGKKIDVRKFERQIKIRIKRF